MTIVLEDIPPHENPTLNFERNPDYIDACAKVLIPKLETKNYSFIERLALALSVTETQWNEKSASGGVDVTIYDVPLGASYKEFKKSVEEKIYKLQTSSDKNIFEHMTLSLLIKENVEIYKSCVEAATQEPKVNVSLVDYKNSVVRLRYFPGLSAPMVKRELVYARNLTPQAVKQVISVIGSNASSSGFDQPVVLESVSVTDPVTLVIKIGARGGQITVPPVRFPLALKNGGTAMLADLPEPTSITFYNFGPGTLLIGANNAAAFEPLPKGQKTSHRWNNGPLHVQAFEGDVECQWKVD